MASLTGQQIDQTYEGLIKTNDEQPVTATLKGLEDGVGNALPVQVSTGGINFTGDADFTNANVIGISAGGIVAATVPFTSSTTNALNQIVGQVTIQAGTFQNGDVLMLKGNLGYKFNPSPGDSGMARVYIGPDSGYAPGTNTPLGYLEITPSADAAFMIPVSKTLNIENVDTFFAVGPGYSATKIGATPDVNLYDVAFPTATLLTYEGVEQLDWSVNQYLSVVFDINNPGDTAITYALSLTKIN